jgi:hypothetical protein
MEAIVVDHSVSRESQRVLQNRIGQWLTQIIEYPGYGEWKNKQLMQTLLEGLIPDMEYDSPPDFDFSADVKQQVDLVQGYHAIISTMHGVRECEFYFRTYPFRGKNISREAHLRTCCELFLSRVYQFKKRWLRQLKWLGRRTQPKGLSIKSLEEDFDARFGKLVAERNKIHHEQEYSDIQTQALGLGDLLSVTQGTPDWMRVSRGSYLRIRRGWVKTVRNTADQLDLFVGVVATLMLTRCRFLPEESNRPA